MIVGEQRHWGKMDNIQVQHGMYRVLCVMFNHGLYNTSSRETHQRSSQPNNGKPKLNKMDHLLESLR